MLNEQNFDYETPQGLYFNKAIILFMIGVGTCLFCCGLSVAGIILFKYKKEKARLMEQLKNNELAPWEGEVLQGEEIEVTPLKPGYGEAVLDFYGNQNDPTHIKMGQIV